GAVDVDVHHLRGMQPQPGERSGEIRRVRDAAQLDHPRDEAETFATSWQPRIPVHDRDFRRVVRDDAGTCVIERAQSWCRNRAVVETVDTGDDAVEEMRTAHASQVAAVLDR